MGITTSQQIQDYYDHFRDTEITYSKDILRTLAVDPRQIYVKCNGGQWPCIINSTSFQFAKIIIGTKGGAYAQISKKEAPPVSLRFYFFQASGQPISFFITSRVTEINPYMNSGDLAIVTLTFTQRPPDDFIERVGSLLEANSNAVRRREERIVISADSKRRLGLIKDETIVFIQNVPRRCVLRDISFGGAKVILLGLERFIINKEVMIRIHFDEPDEIVSLKGTVVATSPVEGRQDIIFACLKFDDATIPLSYKIRINNYLTSIRKHILNVNEQQNAEAQKAKEAAAQAKAEAQSEPAAQTQTAQAEQASDAQNAPAAEPSAEPQAPAAQEVKAEESPKADSPDQNAAQAASQE